jgi:hypothetical protein
VRARVLGTRAQGFPFCGAAEGTLACGPGESSSPAVSGAVAPEKKEGGGEEGADARGRPGRERKERRARAAGGGGKWAGVAHAGKRGEGREGPREERGRGKWAGLREGWAAFFYSFSFFFFYTLPIQTKSN